RVSSRIKDNEIQNVKQLKEKYPQVEFESEDYELSNVPPYLIHLTDTFFDSKENMPLFEEVKFSDSDFMGVVRFLEEKPKLYVGRGLIDVSEPEWYEKGIREIKNPLKVFEHEYEHFLDYQIGDEESKLLESVGKTYEKGYHYFEDLNDPEINQLLIEKNYAKTIEELDEIFKRISETYSTKYSSQMTLKEKYNELAMGAKDKLIESEEFKNSLKIIIENSKKSYDFEKAPYKHTLLELDEDINNKLDSDFISKLAGEYMPVLQDI
ncbi:unnamed protein product, partial [marine sediment metagenome]